MALEISKIKLPSGTEYAIRDDAARDLINDLAGSTSMLGKTTTTIVDGVTSNPVVSINGTNVTAFNGNMVISNDGMKEFIWTATEYSYWQKQILSATDYQYTKINSPSQTQKDEAVYVHHTEAEALATQTTSLDEPWAGGATYIKIDHTGLWYQFGDLSSVSLHKGNAASVVGTGATIVANNPTISLEETNQTGTGIVEVVTAIPTPTAQAQTISMTLTDQSQPAGSVQIADGSVDTFSVSLSSSSSASEDAIKYVPEVSPTTKKYKQESVGTTSVSSVSTSSPKKLVTQSLSFSVSGGMLSITAPGKNNTVTFADGTVTTSGSGAQVVTPAEVSSVTNVATINAATNVITSTLAGPEDAGITVLQSVSATSKYLTQQSSLTLGKSYIAATAQASNVTISPTKKKIKATGTAGQVSFQNTDTVSVAQYDQLYIEGTNSNNNN